MDGITWIGSPNHYQGRNGHEVTHITLHIMVGYLAGTDSVFRNPASQASAHYGIGGDGTIHQYVSEADGSYSDANWASNNSTISIEHQGGMDGVPCTQACIDASARLCADIARRYGWTSLRHDGLHGNVWLHREIPGTDHAGIATQIKVEEELRVKEGKTRYDLGREKFLERVWKWKEEYGNRIVQQQKKMGVSCDWSRARFTMDEGCSKAVRETFCELYDKGLIYKGSRIINWCPHCVTALSDAEVEYVDKPGHLWHIRYPGADGSEGSAMSHAAHMLYVAGNLPEEDISHS